MLTLLLTVIPVLIIIALAAIVAKQARLRRAKKNFITLLALLVVQSIIGYLSLEYMSHPYGIWLVRSVMSFAVLFTYSFFNFVSTFPDEKPRSSVKRVSVVIGVIAVALFCLTPFVFNHVAFINGKYVPTTQLGVIVFGVTVFTLFVSGLVVLLRRFKVKQGKERMQIGYIALGFGIMFGLMLAFNFIGFLITKNGDFNRLTAVFSLPFVGTTAYVMARYRFLDIRIAIQRGIARLLTFGIIFGFFAYLLLFIERNVEATSERNISLLTVVVVLVLTVEPLRRWIYRFVDGLFDNQERKRRDALQRIQLVASSTLQFTSLVERLSSELRTVFGVDVHFLLRDEQHGKLAGATELSLKDPIAGQIVDGKVIITDELPYRIENGEAMLAPLHSWLQSKKVSAALPIGNREDFVGAFLFHDGQGSAPFTTDRVEFLKRFRNQVQFAFASAYAYKLAVERIGA